MADRSGSEKGICSRRNILWSDIYTEISGSYLLSSADSVGFRGEIMTFISVEYYIFLVGIVILYYIAPIRYRWIVLLAANFLFYFTVGRSGIILFIVLIGISYLGGIVLDKSETRLSLRAKQFLLCFILAICFPLAMVKGNALLQKDFSNEGFLFAVPAGLSFFTIQMVAYLIDIYRGEGRAQYNFFKYANSTLSIASLSINSGAIVPSPG